MRANLLATGKTKLIAKASEGKDEVLIHNLPYVTWNDEFSVCLPGKDVWAAQTSANVFEFLARHGVPVAYVGRSVRLDRFYAKQCTMIPIEVVVRLSNEPNSSYSKRHPDVPIGPFDEPQIEFFLKTVKKEFNGKKLKFDDPYIGTLGAFRMHVFNPKVPTKNGTGFFELVGYSEVFHPNPHGLFRDMKTIAVQVGETLAAGFRALGWNIGDFKLEFGRTKDGRVVLADDVNNDSWRARDPEGVERSKQQVRDDNAVTPQTAINYQMVMEMTSQLR